MAKAKGVPIGRSSGMLATPVGSPVCCRQGARVSVGRDDDGQVHLLLELAPDDEAGRLGVGVVAMPFEAEMIGLKLANAAREIRQQGRDPGRSD